MTKCVILLRLALAKQSYTKPSKTIDSNRTFRVGHCRHTMSKFCFSRVTTSVWPMSNKGLWIPSDHRNCRGCMKITVRPWKIIKSLVITSPYLSLRLPCAQHPTTKIWNVDPVMLLRRASLMQVPVPNYLILTQVSKSTSRNVSKKHFCRCPARLSSIGVIFHLGPKPFP